MKKIFKRRVSSSPSIGPWMRMVENLEEFIYTARDEREQTVWNGYMKAIMDIPPPTRSEFDLALRSYNVIGVLGEKAPRGLANKHLHTGIREWGSEMTASRIFGYLAAVRKAELPGNGKHLAQAAISVITCPRWSRLNSFELQVPGRILVAAKALAKMNMISNRVSMTLSKHLAQTPDSSFTQSLPDVVQAMWYLSKVSEVVESLTKRIGMQVRENPQFYHSVLQRKHPDLVLMLPGPLARYPASALPVLQKLQPLVLGSLARQAKEKQNLTNQEADVFASSVIAYSLVSVSCPMLYIVCTPVIQRAFDQACILKSVLVNYLATAARDAQDYAETRKLVVGVMSKRPVTAKLSNDELISLLATCRAVGAAVPNPFKTILKHRSRFFNATLLLRVKTVNPSVAVTVRDDIGCDDISVLIGLLKTVSEEEGLQHIVNAVEKCSVPLKAVLAHPPLLRCYDAGRLSAEPLADLGEYLASQHLRDADRSVTKTILELIPSIVVNASSIPLPVAFNILSSLLDSPHPHPPHLLEALAVKMLGARHRGVPPTFSTETVEWMRKLAKTFSFLPDKTLKEQTGTKKAKETVERWAVFIRDF
eukprot:TRINITY_DN14897_c0_g1_i1.p1 TRINITY_DN14897_c0_g1~~TRINITY_DN14897_c0_g1_i1.p1  ORF type:complete len:607 (+),score=88.51 TRINITY_DN14897_c0_g1_i1:43-1821(+)